jgi:hypothetical protein
MSANLKNNFKLSFRQVCKHFPEKQNIQTYKNFLREEIQKFENKKFTNELEKMIKISEWNELFINLNKMDYHVDKENELLASYNINVVRDSKSQIADIASRVGLKI